MKAADATPESPLQAEVAVELTKVRMNKEGDCDEAKEEATRLTALMLEVPSSSSASEPRAGRQANRVARSSAGRRSLKEASSEEEEEVQEVADCDDDLPCGVCGKLGDDDRAILCEGCDGAFHTFCLDPPLEAIPDGDWFCSHCAAPNLKSAAPKEICGVKEKPSGDDENEMNAPNRSDDRSVNEKARTPRTRVLGST